MAVFSFAKFGKITSWQEIISQTFFHDNKKNIKKHLPYPAF